MHPRNGLFAVPLRSAVSDFLCFCMNASGDAVSAYAMRVYLTGISCLRQGELPLVGNPAPDFEAEAVFDQEFIKVLLSLPKLAS